MKEPCGEDALGKVILGFDFVLLELHHADKLHKIIVAPDVKFRWIFDERGNIIFDRFYVSGGEPFYE